MREDILHFLVRTTLSLLEPISGFSETTSRERDCQGKLLETNDHDTNSIKSFLYLRIESTINAMNKVVR